MLKFFKEVFSNTLYEVDNMYHRHINIIRIILISAFIFTIVNFFDYQRNYFLNQEVFDLNHVPTGYVVWIYPKDKTQLPVMPDTLKDSLHILEDKLNYNVDVWIVGIQTMDNQIIKIEVPDYAIQQFRLGKVFRKSTN